MTACLKSHSHDATLVLTLSDPERRNALGPEIYAAAVEALNVAERNTEVRSVILTGEGAHFCAGGNLQRLLANRSQAAQVQADSIEGLHIWVEALRSFPKPVVAAVEGACAGAGFSLALACDFLLAARNSVFALSYINVGLSPDGGASWHLARRLPRAIALELLMRGERIEPQRLQQLGLINRLCEPGQALHDALRWCASLNALAPNALASIKELVNEAPTHSLHQQLRIEREHFVSNLHQPNGGEGIRAFLEKRPPHYR